MTATLGELLIRVETGMADALAMRQVVIGGAAAFGLLLLVQVGLMAWTARRLRELSRLRERMSRLADGLALLTDTTEAGLHTLIRQVEQLGQTAMAKPAPRAAVSRRVAAAARKGQALQHIAERELISESEVRLHVTMANARSSADATGETPCLAASTSR